LFFFWGGGGPTNFPNISIVEGIIIQDRLAGASATGDTTRKQYNITS